MYSLNNGYSMLLHIQVYLISTFLPEIRVGLYSPL